MKRADLLARLRTEGPWDVAVIGGGATGLGTAVDAAARGFRTVLLEAHDFAKGTSSRSTKLIHGGVRYLAQGNLGLVREALHERTLLRRNAPHLVRDRAFLVPCYGWLDLPWYAAGLKLYDLLAGRADWRPSRMVGRAEALELAPTLAPEGLRGGVVYHDGQFDDARLALALALTLLDLGGLPLTGLPVTGLRKRGDRLAGVEARDEETGETFAVEARVVVNATGVFADSVRRLDDPAAADSIATSQGAHLVVGRAFLPGETAVLVPKTDDGRVVFAIPWLDHVLIGTTDTPVDRPEVEPRPLASELEFLLRHAGRTLNRTPGPADVLSVFAGLRPLVKGGGGRTARLSREHAVAVSATGLVTITGGKWTTYRAMGADAVNEAIAVGGLPRRPCVTESLRLHGATASPPSGPFSEYGAHAPAVARLCAEEPGGNDLLHPELPYRVGEVVWAARRELARTVEDVLARRTRALLLNARAARAAAPGVAARLAPELGRDPAWQADQVRRFQQLSAAYLINK